MRILLSDDKSFFLRELLSYLDAWGSETAFPFPGYLSPHGVRSIRVDRFPWTDDAVFEEVLGKERTAALAAERPTPR